MPKNLNFVTRIFLISLLIFSTILLSKFILEGLGGANLSNFNLPPPTNSKSYNNLFICYLSFLSDPFKNYFLDNCISSKFDRDSV